LLDLTTVHTCLNAVSSSTAAAQSAFLAIPVPDRTLTTPARPRTHSSGTYEPNVGLFLEINE